jgi:6-phosphogluconolactonase
MGEIRRDLGNPARVLVESDQVAIAHRAAIDVARQLREAVTQRGLATLAVSGGSTPALLFDALTGCDVPWAQVHVFQVDERIAPTGHSDRNVGQLYAHLLSRVALPPENIHTMPVELAPPGEAARRYERLLRATCHGLLDVIHLGLGDDGHTASLVPGDPVLDVKTTLVATTKNYRGRRRITLTYQTLNQARSLVWLATGANKIDAVTKLLALDPNIPAGRVRATGTNTLYLDAAAAAGLPQ